MEVSQRTFDIVDYRGLDAYIRHAMHDTCGAVGFTVHRDDGEGLASSKLRVFWNYPEDRSDVHTVPFGIDEACLAECVRLWLDSQSIWLKPRPTDKYEEYHEGFRIYTEALPKEDGGGVLVVQAIWVCNSLAVGLGAAAGKVGAADGAAIAVEQHPRKPQPDKPPAEESEAYREGYEKRMSCETPERRDERRGWTMRTMR